jgi:hypothetical protein
VRIVFASSAAAEKSVEGTALKTRTGARRIAVAPHPCPAYITTLFVIAFFWVDREQVFLYVYPTLGTTG